MHFAIWYVVRCRWFGIELTLSLHRLITLHINTVQSIEFHSKKISTFTVVQDRNRVCVSFIATGGTKWYIQFGFFLNFFWNICFIQSILSATHITLSPHTKNTRILFEWMKFYGATLCMWIFDEVLMYSWFFFFVSFNFLTLLIYKIWTCTFDFVLLCL